MDQFTEWGLVYRMGKRTIQDFIVVVKGFSWDKIVFSGKVRLKSGN